VKDSGPVYPVSSLVLTFDDNIGPYAADNSQRFKVIGFGSVSFGYAVKVADLETPAGYKAYQQFLKSQKNHPSPAIKELFSKKK